MSIIFIVVITTILLSLIFEESNIDAQFSKKYDISLYFNLSSSLIEFLNNDDFIIKDFDHENLFLKFSMNFVLNIISSIFIIQITHYDNVTQTTTIINALLKST